MRASIARATTLRQATLRIMRAWALYSPSMDFVEFVRPGPRDRLRRSRGLARRNAGRRARRLHHPDAFLYEPVTRLHQLNQLVQAGAPRANAFSRFSTSRKSPVCEEGEAGRGDRGRHSLRRRQFRLRQRLPALSNISFHARPGETIALVGATGAGKSTLVNLLARFYEFTSGAITIDGKPIRDFGVHALREMIGMVTQESFLFNGTIRENLLLGKPDATDEELLEAAEAANARAFIDRLPNGLEAWSASAE